MHFCARHGLLSAAIKLPSYKKAGKRNTSAVEEH